MVIRLETKIGEKVLDNMHHLIILMTYFSKEFTKKDYCKFMKAYSSYRLDERKSDWDDYYHFRKEYPERLNAPTLLNISALLERNLIKIVRTESLGCGKRNYYEVNMNYFEDLIRDIHEIQDNLLYGEDDECVKQGVKIVKLVQKTIANN